MAKIVQLYENGITDENYDRFATLVELALTVDELEAFEQLPGETIEATLAALQRALGTRSRIARSTVRRICGVPIEPPPERTKARPRRKGWTRVALA
jgi:hypothetical protein